MAIQFAQDAKNRIAEALAGAYSPTNGTNIAIFPNSVPFSSAYFLTAISGIIINATGVTMTRTNNRFSSNIRTVTATQSGTLGWFILGGGTSLSGTLASLSNGRFISDSIGLSGSGALLTVNTMDISPGTVVTLQFNLSII